MFIYSLRAGTLKFFGIIGVALAALIVLIAFVPGEQAELSAAPTGETVTYHYDKVKTPEDRLEFLRQFGWEVRPEPLEQAEVTIPGEFDKVYAGYNEIQKNQGLDLGRYKNKTVSRYTYEVLNYPDYEGRVLVNLLVYRNRVIGGDVCTSDINGFIHGFARP
ncbi:MAG: DUF4830 domain-containing protein [Clostridia bacterium]|nr:DUF4830 domain-containing protein [Clostridia bacterium]